jgi:nucleoside-diphosphate-sugar epimerase
MIGIESGPQDALPLTENAPLRSKLYPYRGDESRDPDDPRKWLDNYDKILVERAVMTNTDLPGTILRLPMVHGPGDRQHRLYEYLKRMDDGRPAIIMDRGMANWRGPRGYVADMAKAVAMAALDERAAGRVFNVADPDALSTTEWVRLIAEAVDWPGEVTVVSKEVLPDHLVVQMNTDHDFVVDSIRIRQELGYRETLSRSEALRQTVDWERANPPDAIDPQRFDYAAEDAVLAQL